MVIEISAGSAETDAKAETVSPCVLSPARTVTMVTPAGKWRSAFRNSSDEITVRVSSTSTIATDMTVSPHCKRSGHSHRSLFMAFDLHLLSAAWSPVVDNGFRGRDSSINSTGGRGAARRTDHGQDEEGEVGREGGAESA